MNINKLAVVYVRVSTQYQIDNYSVQGQRELDYLAARYGFARVEIREEQGVSAETITARPVMKVILEEIAKGVIGALIVASFTRLTRDMDDIDGRIIKKACRENDCVIITPEKLYDFTNETDDDLADLQFFFSKIQKRMNLKPMIRGEYTKAKNGGYVGQPLSLGYQLKWCEETSGKGTRYVADLAVNEQEAEIVRYIHDMYPNMLYRTLAVHLNERAARGEIMYFPIKYKNIREKYNSTHRPWRDADIRNVIQNALYVGRMHYNVNRRSSFLRDLEPVYSYRQDLRILSDEIFERNQEIAARRRNVNMRTKRFPHLFSGIMRCPHCGDVMAGHALTQGVKKKKTRFSYNCARYSRSGECEGYWINERDILTVVLPVLTELIQKNLRDLLVNAAAADPLHTQLEGEIKAELAKNNLNMKNLLDAVKAGALSMEQIKEQNGELQDAKRRLEKHLETVRNVSRVSKELAALIETFDRNFDGALAEFVSDRFRFNMFIRLFFSELTVEIDRAGLGWRKGKKKGELPLSNPRIVSFTLDPRFDEFVEQTGLELPDALKNLTCYSPKRSERQGSPCM